MRKEELMKVIIKKITDQKKLNKNLQILEKYLQEVK